MRRVEERRRDASSARARSEARPMVDLAFAVIGLEEEAQAAASGLGLAAVLILLASILFYLARQLHASTRAARAAATTAPSAPAAPCGVSSSRASACMGMHIFSQAA